MIRSKVKGLRGPSQTIRSFVLGLHLYTPVRRIIRNVRKNVQINIKILDETVTILNNS